MEAFLQRMTAGIVMALALAVGLILVPFTMGAFYEDSAVAFTVSTLGQVLRPYTALPITSALIAAAAAWATGGFWGRMVAGGVAAAIGQAILTVAGWMGLRMAVASWGIPPAALGTYQRAYETMPLETFFLLPAAFIVGAISGWAVHVARDEPEDAWADEPPQRRRLTRQH